MTTTNQSTTFRLAGNTAINRMGYGSMQLTGPGVFGEVADRNNAIKVLRAAVEGGVNFIDTAEAYGPQLNESLIADALHPYPAGLVIATKGGFRRPGHNKWIPDGDPAFIRECIDGSLKRLKLDQIPLWQLHRFDPKIPVEETLAPVAEAVKAGKIKWVGLSEVDVDQVERAEKVVSIVSVQNQYNLASRKWDKIVDYTASRGMGFIPWYPLASGPQALADKIGKISTEHQATAAQIGLAWLLKRSPNILLIPGTKSLEHLRENLEAGRIELSDEEFEELSR